MTVIKRRILDYWFLNDLTIANVLGCCLLSNQIQLISKISSHKMIMLWSRAFAEFTCIWALAVQLNILQVPDAYSELTLTLVSPVERSHWVFRHRSLCKLVFFLDFPSRKFTAAVFIQFSNCLMTNLTPFLYIFVHSLPEVSVISLECSRPPDREHLFPVRDKSWLSTINIS